MANCPYSFLIVAGLWAIVALVQSLRRRGALDAPLGKWRHFQRSMGFEVAAANNAEKQEKEKEKGGQGRNSIGI